MKMSELKPQVSTRMSFTKIMLEQKCKLQKYTYGTLKLCHPYEV